MRMKSVLSDKTINYNGEQLSPLFAYRNFGILGDSVVCFRGACDIAKENIADIEDLRQGSQIAGSDMLHFIFEIFDRELMSGVFLQRLFAGIVKEELSQLNPKAKELVRKGDDLFLKDQKLSISVAAPSTNSILVHFAMNISTDGTPVKTCGLKDFAVEPMVLAEKCLTHICAEYTDIVEATYKVRSV